MVPLVEMLHQLLDGFFDLDAYDTIAMKIKGDGRCYISTIYTENWVNSPGQLEDNSWQAFVYMPQDRWQIMKIPLDRYLPTWSGNVIDAKLEMNRTRIVGMSLSVNAEDGVPGAKTGPGADPAIGPGWAAAQGAGKPQAQAAAELYRRVLKAVQKQIDAGASKEHFHDFVTAEFRSPAGTEADAKVRLRLAGDYAYLLSSVHHHKVWN